MSAIVGGALERGIFVDGRAHALEGEALTITNPGTGELVGRAANASPEAVDAAVRVAHAALPEWSRRGYADRAALLHACAQAFEDSVEDLVPLLVAEQGKTIREATIELRKAADTLEHYAGMGREVRGVSVPGLAPGVNRPLELPDDPALQQARPRAAVRQHRRGQARRHDAVHHPAPGRDPHRGGSAGRRGQRRARHRAGDRRGARDPPARAQGRLHRLDAYR
jgi:hypothetical protein